MLKSETLLNTELPLLPTLCLDASTETTHRHLLSPLETGRQARRSGKKTWQRGIQKLRSQLGAGTWLWGIAGKAHAKHAAR